MAQCDIGGFLTGPILHLLTALSISPIQWHATETEGFSRAGEQEVAVSHCSLSLSAHEGLILLRLQSDPETGISLSVAETIQLPVAEGVIPSFQEGFSGVYEDGELLLEKKSEFALQKKEVSLRISIDPDLKRPQWASGKFFIEDGFTRQPRQLLQAIFCRF